ncbi:MULTISPECIES: DUF202 domain-containing protein [Kocuria]|nr:DUF202 domain-containing protein [Kocuria palustris]MBN6753173.1 DUF202 domain-containing protein [Kocuria palustris]MBN6758392.1 DUF202 domain-containing protein [Kocuria palustris]MBN6763480.1 DUF202 domain-containing protein [Kocuria palustris]MBN6782678.1 DUF202 domain-containing protein [Kocuria palustris]MBN6799108.1 DUF202 domain-containing protein [Kocuria palustris]
MHSRTRPNDGGKPRRFDAADGPIATRSSRRSRERPTHDDPGLQPERTSLAWGRTLLALVVAAALLLRWLPHHGLAPVLPLVAAAVLALGIWLRQGLRYRRGARSVALESSAPDPLEILAISAAVVVLGALSLLTILLA